MKGSFRQEDSMLVMFRTLRDTIFGATEYAQRLSLHCVLLYNFLLLFCITVIKSVECTASRGGFSSG